MRFIIDWPDRRLFPNARVHWAVKAGKVHEARNRAHSQAVACLKSLPEDEKDWLDSNNKLPYGLVITPPDNRHRDEDNIIAALKASLDGIATGLGVNDSRFRLSWIRWSEPAKTAHIVVALLEPPPLDFLENFYARK